MYAGCMMPNEIENPQHENKLCGCKEKCFINGQQWGHLEGVMCKYLSEIKDKSGEFYDICHVDKSKVTTYTTETQYNTLTTTK